MFNIVELDEVICQQLSKHDLAQCARVNKQWHSIVIPLLWNNLSSLGDENRSNFKMNAFRNMVGYSFLYERQREEGDNFPETPPESFGFTKYGHLVRILPAPRILISCLPHQESLTLRRNGFQRLLAWIGSLFLPTTNDFLRHVYKHCPSFQVQTLAWDITGLPDDLFKTVVEFVAPRARSISTGPSTVRLRFNTLPKIPLWKIKHVLDHCSSVLEELTFEFDIDCKDYHEDEEQELTEWTSMMTTTTPWTNLKILNLKNCSQMGNSKGFWPWLWKRCGQANQLEIGMISSIDIEETMVEDMLNLMQNVHSISFSTFGLNDQQIAAILSNPRRNGWWVVQVKPCLKFELLSFKALMRHCSTLRVLVVVVVEIGLTHHGIVLLLSSCPNLQVMCYAAWHDGHPVHLPAGIFIDRDPDTGLLKPWACESSLKALTVKITWIPRPQSGIQEAYPGQCQEIQGHVYDRLARLTNLESLMEYNTISGTGYRYDCLEMSLQSGLHKLAGLRAMKELNVRSLKTLIGVDEVRWMTEHWPDLRAIYGLEESEEDHHKQAAEWLRNLHPEIRLK